ncbi:hypothetical protein PENSPDRAFT_696709, partial [Peniophora sp. CONT]
MSPKDPNSTDNTSDSVRPRFTLLSTTPGNRIIKQREHHGHWCIPSKLADMKFDDPVMLLAMLNAIFGTTYSFCDTPEALGNIMDYCISRGYDLGMAYGMLRRFWALVSEPEIDLVSLFELLELEDRMLREKAISERLVINCHIPPRRVWDLYSHRVLPFWAADILAVSHAWMYPTDCRSVMTPINGNKWPVPIPKDLRLDNLRIELLNLLIKEEMQYVWLDVLCLRQVGGKPSEESLRPKEWAIDVPTIGAIYQHCVYITYYLNGLGRPFEENDLDDARHWCNRAWTLQEWCCRYRMISIFSTSWVALLGGITEQSPRFDIQNAQGDFVCYARADYTKRLGERMSTKDARSSTTDIITAAALMSKRQAERELDKLAGLAYIVCDDVQPVFDATQDVEDAWLPFVDCLTSKARGRLFFLFPVAGDGKYKWTPSWNQLLRGAKELDKYD